MFTFTARADGTNVFVSKPLGIFPVWHWYGVSFPRKFMKPTKTGFDNLKLRVSYGSVGNARKYHWRQDYKNGISANKQYYSNETVQSALNCRILKK